MKNKLLVFQSDFGREEGTVSQMYGVALGVDPSLCIHEITHEITPFDIWEASYRLFQTQGSWPAGTVFVSVVDPGVGSERKSVVVQTDGGHLIVTPDNGSLTHTVVKFGIIAVREIDETVNRAPDSENSHTFHGRDVYGYTGARLAAGIIDFEDVGPLIQPEKLILLPLLEPRGSSGAVNGVIDIHDVHYGNVWTNIPSIMARENGMALGDTIEVVIENDGVEAYRELIPYSRSFSAVPVGGDVLYDNELLYLALSVNQGNFAEVYNIGYGSGWTISLRKNS